jgi:hypothetical protein
MDRLVPEASSFRYVAASSFPLEPEHSPITVGRDKDSAIAIADPTVSALHALLEHRGVSWVVSDVSRHGTEHRPREQPPVRLLGTSRRLQHEDLLVFGSTGFYFLRGTAQAIVADGTPPPQSTKVPLTVAPYGVLMELSRPLRADPAAAPAANAEIAAVRFTSVDAVRTHLKALYVLFGIPAEGLTQTQRRVLLANQWWRAILKGSDLG